jgi:hypothetical protein
MSDRVSKIKTLTILYSEDDEELKGMSIRALEGPCDLCGKEGDVMYVLRLFDGGIYGVCKKCFEKLDF